MKKHSVLATKLVIGFVLMAVLVCAAGTTVGYMQYKRYIQKQYNQTAYEVAQVFEDFLEPEEIDQYVALAKGYKEGTVAKETIEETRQSSRYQELLRQLQFLRENMDANDIYLAYLDGQELDDFDGNMENWNPMTYIFDSYMDPDKVFVFGDMGGLNPAFVEDARQVSHTGQRADNFFISKSAYGYNTSAILPVVRDGKTIAVVGVEIPMATLESALQDYLLRAILVMTVVVFVCQALSVNYLYRSMVSPINLIAEEASRFVKEENQISEKLSKVKTGDEIQTLSETLYQMEHDINQYIDNLTKVTAEKERIGAELNVATQIQADMLPSIFPAFPDREEFDIYATMDPAKEVGGDLYDFFLVDPDHLAMVVGDVSGKGVPAALFMVIAKTLIKNQAQMGKSPKEILESVNDQLCENNEADMFVTVWLGILDIRSGRIIAASAGHEYPLVRRGGAAFEFLEDPHGLPLGVMPGMPHENYEISLAHGDSIFIYSDGAPDSANSQEEQFGGERLKAVANEAANAAPTEILHHVKQEIDRFVGDAAQFDDITLLCMRYEA